MRRTIRLLAVIATMLAVGGGVALAADAIIGTDGNDTIKGTIEGDSIIAKDGDDKIYGLGGEDSILGGRGSDRSRDGGGHDIINGGRGRDFLFGGAGEDLRFGGDGDDLIAESYALDEADVDHLYGEDGDDFLESVNFPASKDILRCGTGVDEVQADLEDDVDESCEKVQIID